MGARLSPPAAEPPRSPGRLDRALNRALAEAEALLIAIGERLLAALETVLLRVWRVERQEWEEWRSSRYRR